MFSEYIDMEFRRMSASWFVSYCYYNLCDKNHTIWQNSKNSTNRKSAYKRCIDFRMDFLRKVLGMSEARLNRNQLGLDAKEIYTMAKACIAKIKERNCSLD